MKAHSGWAALVVAGKRDGDFEVVDRRRIELVEDEWAKQPYHAAEDLSRMPHEMWLSAGSKRRTGSRSERCTRR